MAVLQVGTDIPEVPPMTREDQRYARHLLRYWIAAARERHRFTPAGSFEGIEVRGQARLAIMVLRVIEGRPSARERRVLARVERTVEEGS